MSDSYPHHPITYRPFETRDVAAAYRLSTEVRWPHRAEDWDFVSNIGEGFVAEDASGVLGTALCWKYGSETASLGMVIVSPAQQSRGIGRKLMELLLEALGRRVTLLHATPAGQPLYEKLGFEKIGTLHQHQSAAFQAPAIDLPPNETLRPVTPDDTPRLAELASRAGGLDRSAVLPALLEIAEGVALERDGALVGFALFRPFGRGHAIGPVVALDTPESAAARAKALISYWLAKNTGAFTRIDMPDGGGLSSWLEEIGLPRVDTVVKMVRNGVLTADPQTREFGIINQALG
ncbi:GNAT family N-acetyltransferase [Paraburkholderia sp. GAS334]|uniref:GNAT family N-acetyltransferase n=1 Tax=Paraburkholderia sp. GAS334 TaxID=3035131 RepID=UPI003D1D2811